MSLILVAYDLKQNDKDYASLHEAIKSCGNQWWHYLESVWIVKTELTPDEFCDKIQNGIENNDFLFVIDITNKKYQGRLTRKAWEWLKNNSE